MYSPEEVSLCISATPLSARVLFPYKVFDIPADGTNVKLFPDLEDTVAGLITILQLTEFPDFTVTFPRLRPFWLAVVLLIMRSFVALEATLTASTISAETCPMTVVWADNDNVADKMRAKVIMIDIVKNFISTAFL